ncbi:MAG TPA: family 16 glycoside hydrolase [Pirellulales bacterium]
MFRSRFFVMACAGLLFACTAMADEPGFEPIFDGRSLHGWRGQDMSFWSVEDGAITGTISLDHAPPMNQYLVWQPELVENFELKLDFRLTGSNTNITNGGFQFRSRRLPNGDVAGYQVDNNFGQPWKVRLYDEFGRHDLALEGERSRFDKDGVRHVEKLSLDEGASDFHLDQWHEYHLIAVGEHLTLRINGHLVAECTDGDPQQFEALGVLAMQLHTGPPMKAQFRNLRLKRLPPAANLSVRDRLLATAALDWRPGERTTAHQPPLKLVGNATLVKAERADSGAAQFGGGYFDAGPDWNSSGEAITVYVRAKPQDGKWHAPLFSKTSGPGQSNFNLHSVTSAGGDQMVFEVTTDQGSFKADFPLSRIDTAGWHGIVARYDGRSIELVCDGSQMTSAPAAGRLVPNKAPLLIGAEMQSGQAARTFSGEIAEAALWTRALSEREIKVLSAGGSP